MDAAVRNPMFQDYAKKSIFQSLSGDDNYEHPDAVSHSSIQVQNQIEGIDDDELNNIKIWAKRLRLAMIAISTLMIITAFYNIGTTSQTLANGKFSSSYL